MIFAKCYWGVEIRYLISGMYKRLPLLYCRHRRLCVANGTICTLIVLGCLRWRSETHDFQYTSLI